MTDFVLHNAAEQDQTVLAACKSITLKKDDFAAFLDALDPPAEPNPALKRAFARHNDQAR